MNINGNYLSKNISSTIIDGSVLVIYQGKGASLCCPNNDQIMI